MSESLQKTVVFLGPYAPPSYFSTRYFMPEMRALGYRVLYWNVGRLLGYDMKIPRADMGVMEYREVFSLRELRQLIRRENRTETVFVPQISRSLEGLPVLRLLDRAKVTTAFFGWGYLPYSDQRYAGVLEKIKKILRARRKLEVIRSVFSAVRLRLQPKLRAYDVVFTAGSFAAELHAREARRMIPVRHFDLETAQAVGEEPGQDVGACVFIDAYLPFHPDFRINKRETVDPKSYFESINKCFDRIEEITGRPVVIAVCPKADYQENPYGGRKLVLGKTYQLIRDSSLVITHVSTAVSFAVLHRKPIISLYSSEINALHPEYSVATRALGDILHCPLIDMNHCQFDFSTVMSIDETGYAHYCRKFIVSTEDPRPSAQIVVATFDELTSGATGH